MCDKAANTVEPRRPEPGMDTDSAQTAMGRGAEITGSLNNSASDDYALSHLFQYHAPNRVQLKQYENIREAAKHFAKVVLLNTPHGADRSAAIRKIREAVMTANAGVALNGFSL